MNSTISFRAAQASSEVSGFSSPRVVRNSTPPPENAKTVQEIFTAFLRGKSIREIARDLEGRNIPSPSGGKTWHISTLSTILSNQVYTGHRVYGKQHKTQVPFSTDPRMGTQVKKVRTGAKAIVTEDAVFPTIVDVVEFNRVFSLLSAKRTQGLKNSRSKSGTKTVIPLAGRVHSLGHKMESDAIVKTGNIRFRVRGNRTGTASVTVTERDLEETVNAWLGRAFTRRNLPNILKQLNERAPSVQRNIAELEAKQSKVRQQAARLLDLIEDGGDNAMVERYRLRTAEVQKMQYDIEDLQREDIDVAAAETLLKALSRDVSVVLNSTSRERLKVLYERMNLRLDYDDETKTVNISAAPNILTRRGSGRNPNGSLGEPVLNHHNSVGGKEGAPGGTRTPNLILRTDLLFH